MSQQLPAFYEFGPFRLDPRERVLRRGSEVVLLSPKVVETLLLLVEQAGKVQSKDFLIEALWPDSFVEEGSLTQNISILRKNLGTDENGKQYIETLPKRGYRFAAEVRTVSSADDSQPVITAARVDLAPEPAEIAETPKTVLPVVPAPSRTAISRPLMIAVLVGMLCIAAAVTASMWERKVTSVSELKTIAILPFKDIRGVQNEEYLGIGLTDSLITKLGNLRSLSVRPTSAIRKYNGIEIDPVKAGKELAVEAVMEGSVNQDGNKLRITVQLVRVSDGLSLWSEKFEAEVTDLLSIEDTISTRVAQRLMKEVSAEERSRITKNYTADPEAHRLYLQARYFWNQRTKQSLFKAIELFEQAIKLDPNYALAYTGLADCYYTMGDSTYALLRPTESFPKARIAAQKAIDIDESMVEAHTALGNIQVSYDWNLSGAQKSFQHALELNPNYMQALQGYGWYFIANRQYAEAEEVLLRAKALNPLSTIAAADLSHAPLFAGNYDRALEIINTALETDPDHVSLHFCLWRIYNQKGDHQKALGEIELMQGKSGRLPLFMIWHAVSLSAMGKTDEANKIYEELMQEKAKGTYISPVLMTALCSELGKLDEAMQFLETGIAERNDVIFIRVAPEFKKLWTHPRYAEVMRNAGLEP